MTTSLHKREEINQELHHQYQLLLEWFEQLSDDRFIDHPVEGKWSAGQHADHLIKSTQPLNKALRMPRIIMKGMFGINNRQERSYDEVVEKYRAALTKGGQAPSNFVPPEIPADQKPKLLKTLQSEADRLSKIVSKWNEKDLSKYILPHPLLGKMTLREMMFFTIYHTQHHLRILEERH